MSGASFPEWLGPDKGKHAAIAKELSSEGIPVNAVAPVRSPVRGQRASPHRASTKSRTVPWNASLKGRSLCPRPGVECRIFADVR